MSATRYSGELKITLTYRDPPKGMYPNGDYRATITWPWRHGLPSRGPKSRITVYVGAPKHLRHAVDSPDAFDEAAHAAISFAAEEVPEIENHASMSSTDATWMIARPGDYFPDGYASPARDVDYDGSPEWIRSEQGRRSKRAK